MRFRRFSRKRRVSEPRTWARTTMQNDLHIDDGAALMSGVVLFDSQLTPGFNPGEGTEWTVRRIVLPDWPVFQAKGTLTGFDTVVFNLEWFIVKVKGTIPAPAADGGVNIFAEAMDILAMGSEQASFFASQNAAVTEAYNSFAQNRTWIDVKVSRRVEQSENIILFAQSNLLCDGAFIPDAEFPTGWCIRSRISVLYQRALRVR